MVGTVPPPGGERAARLGRIAAELVQAGHEVEVCSPDARSAAHDHRGLAGLRLALRLLAGSRRCQGLVLRLEPGLPFGADTSRLARGLVLACTGLACAGFAEVTLHLDSPVPIPYGLGGRATRELWRRATRVVVESDEDRRALSAIPWLDDSRVEVAPLEATGGERPTPWPSANAADVRAAAQAAVSARAAATRRVERAGAELPGAAGRPGSAFEAGADEVRLPATAAARVVARKLATKLVRRAG